MIQRELAALMRAVIGAAQKAGDLPAFDVPAFELERPARKEHGDWASGVALTLAKQAKMSPRDLADIIVKHFGPHDHVAKIEVAGPGFINFTLSHTWLTGVVRAVEEAGESWGRSTADEPERTQVEFVSANPNGPLHLGHGRWAAIGDALSTLIDWSGHPVQREFYINDAGRQMELFGRSVAARYLEQLGHAPPEPEGEAEVDELGHIQYRGAYVTEIAKEIILEVGEAYVDVPDDERVAFMRVEGQRRMLLHQRQTLERFGVAFDVWFSEKSLHDAGAVDRVIELLTELGHIYEQDGAKWLRTTDFGDDKDRVVVRSNGEKTYLAPDIAYFMDKIRRGFDRIIYLWGADHHGYVPRMRAAIAALGEDPEHAEFLIGQLVGLSRDGQPVQMSKRTGDAITFEDLLDEVGVDAARYHFLRTGLDQTLNLDLDEMIAQSQENPVYYVQYAHARICSIQRKAEEGGVSMVPLDDVVLEELQHESELDLLRKIAELPEAVQVAANLRAPHRMTRYAEDLASLFHAFYRDCRVVGDDAVLTQARLHLCHAAQITLRNVFAILGVGAPEQM